MSMNRKGAFIPLDCSTLTPNLIESELFGHVEGAFTDAPKERTGPLVAAGHGTLFLDEIGELDLSLQPKLLRTLQEQQFRPVGATVLKPFDSRIIAATSRDLRRDAESGKFRADLYYRLNVLQIELPPLRKRKSDIPLLVASFIEKYSEHDAQVMFSDAAMMRLLAYDWPGNVRELENTVECALAVSSGRIIGVSNLSTTLQTRATDSPHEGRSLESWDELEDETISRAQSAAGSNEKEAARALGIGRTPLHRKLTKKRT